MAGYLNTICSICTNDYDENESRPFSIIPCSHTYCKHCLDKMGRDFCPGCRSTITEIVENRVVLEMLAEIRWNNE